MDQKDLDIRLIAWREGVRRSKPKSRVRVDMDDVAQEYVVKLLEAEQEGKAVPIWPGDSPDDVQKEIDRIARRQNDVVLEPFEDRIQQPHLTSEKSRMRRAAQWNLEKVKVRFTKLEFDQMRKHCTEHAVTQKSLAECAKIPYRTFKHRVKKLKSLA